jgi:hypothetical protein
MNLHFPLRKLRISSLTLGAALSLAPLAKLPAVGQIEEQQSSQTQQQPPQLQQSAQQPSNSQPPQQPEAKKKKVWTNDDVVSLRTPADVYLAEKEAQEAAAVEAAKEAAKTKLGDAAGTTQKLPPTVEETRKLIAAKGSQIADDQQALDRYTVELPNEPTERKDRMQEEIKRITDGLPKERSELKILQDHLEKLNKAQVNDVPAPPPPSL